jgi:5'-phosphate synthase pdxT subunit
MQSAPHIGILCLQGDYEAHGRVLAGLGVASWRDVRRGRDLAGLQGLVLPGGESTTMWHFLRRDGFDAALMEFGRRGGALYGTCAGTILLAAGVRNPESRGLGLLDIDVERNSYGRQLESRVARAALEEGGDMEAVLIRAPRIVRCGPGVRVRARLDGDPAWVESGRITATTYHPELSPDPRVHAEWLETAAQAAPFSESVTSRT